MKGYVALIAFYAAVFVRSVQGGGCTTHVNDLTCCCMCASADAWPCLGCSGVSKAPCLLFCFFQLMMAAIIGEILPLRRSR